MPLVTYSALRLGLLAACFAVGYWAGLRTWLLLGVAVFAAWALSYVLLAGPRDAAAADVARRVERRRSGTGRRFPAGAVADAAVEDALDDRARAHGAGARAPAGARGATDRPVDADDPGRGDHPVHGDHPVRADHPRPGDYPDDTARPSPKRSP